MGTTRQLSSGIYLTGDNIKYAELINDEGKIKDTFLPSIGAEGAVRYDEAQTLTAEQKAQARDNIGAGGLPDQTGKNGKYLKTDGTIASWEAVDALPAQSASTNGKVLKSNGSAASWEDDLSWPIRTYSLDFGPSSTMVGMFNMYQAMHLKRIVSDNVASIKLTRVGTAVQETVPVSGDINIAVDAEQELIWEITRTTDKQLAVIGIRFQED